MQRDTRQRRAIREVLEQADRPLSPGELLEAAHERVPGIGQATIYRNLKALEDKGWLAVVTIPGQPSRYERAGKAHHHHFLCRSCDAAYEVSGCPGDLEPLTPAGFRLESHELVLYGLCQTCLAG
ncbi:MAG: transcriptional repressor [Acidobacteria bacterium]|nr:MAG: transcriptional repressor [Acidobacteriota bacterium]